MKIFKFFYIAILVFFNSVSAQNNFGSSFNNNTKEYIPIKADFHTHGVNEERIDMYNKKGYSLIAITDYEYSIDKEDSILDIDDFEDQNAVKRYAERKYQMVVWNGIEAILPQHYTIFGITEWIEPGDYIHYPYIDNPDVFRTEFLRLKHEVDKQNGFAIFAHPPFDPAGRITQFELDGYEIDNCAKLDSYNKYKKALELNGLKLAVSDDHYPSSICSDPGYSVVFYESDKSFNSYTLKESLNNFLSCAFSKYGQSYYCSSQKAREILNFWNEDFNSTILYISSNNEMLYLSNLYGTITIIAFILIIKKKHVRI